MPPDSALQRGSLQGLFVIDAPVRMRMARLRSRNPSWSEQHIANILAMQATLPAVDGAQANAIHNDGSQEQLQAQVAALHQHYLQLWN